MAKYMAYWTKAYYATGEVEIEADSEEQAYEIAFDNIGDYEGSMQYDPHGDLIEIIARAARKVK